MNPKVTMVLRILLGAMMLIFGLNKFIGFMPMPLPDNQMGEMFKLLGSSPFMNIIGVIEVVGGLMLVLGKYVPLSLTFIIAILFNASLFHLFYDDPASGMGAYVGLILSLILVYGHKDRFKSLLSA